MLMHEKTCVIPIFITVSGNAADCSMGTPDLIHIIMKAALFLHNQQVSILISNTSLNKFLDEKSMFGGGRNPTIHSPKRSCGTRRVCLSCCQ